MARDGAAAVSQVSLTSACELDKEQLIRYLVGEKNARTLEHLETLIDKTLAS